MYTPDPQVLYTVKSGELTQGCRRFFSARYYQTGKVSNTEQRRFRKQLYYCCRSDRRAFRKKSVRRRHPCIPLVRKGALKAERTPTTRAQRPQGMHEHLHSSSTSSCYTVVQWAPGVKKRQVGAQAHVCFSGGFSRL